MSYKELKGNIFNSEAMAIVNTINCVGVMGKGIALEFRLRYPEMFEYYRKVCNMRQLQPGQILPYRKSKPWILNFVIKDNWKDPSKVEWIEMTLVKFVERYREMGISSIAFPWMGAMNGGIPIEQIKELTRKYLSNLSDIEIEVYEFDTLASDPLFDNLKKILISNSSLEDLAILSKIKARYWVKIIHTIETNQLSSLYQVCNFKVEDKKIIGKTNIERLYTFLSNNG